MEHKSLFKLILHSIMQKNEIGQKSLGAGFDYLWPNSNNLSWKIRFQNVLKL